MAKTNIMSIKKIFQFIGILITVGLPVVSFPQKIITGKVISEKTGVPIEGASVYFNNTSIGTSANSTGQFSLQLPDAFNTELIVSAVGYERMVFNTEGSDLQNKNMIFKLMPKEQSLRDVLILTDKVRAKYLAIFEKNFLGITAEASRSKIENRRDIFFTSGEGKNSFKAYSDTPLVIINRMLGYKISFELVDFLFDEQSGRTYYYGYTRFEEMGDKGRWQKNRKRCYYGSTAHFYTSLVAKRLEQEKYRIYLIKTSGMSADTSRSNSSPQQKMDMAVTITADEIVKPDSTNPNNYNITFKGKLMVQYDKNPASKNYLKTKTFLQGSMPVGYRSYILLKSPFISVNVAGIVNNPMDVEYSGYWIYEKAANMLPFNYTPD